ncbi:MAG: DinB family protein [Chloroflexota bacterium]
MSEKYITTQKELIAHIERDWNALNQFLDSLSDTQWTTIQNEDGWTIKDHVAHLTAWENYALAFITGKPPHEGLGVSIETYLSEDVEAANIVIYEAHKDDSLESVRANFQRTHEALLAIITALTDSDVNKPYKHYQPDLDASFVEMPAMNVLYGNTAHHFRTHQAWMEAMFDHD